MKIFFPVKHAKRVSVVLVTDERITCLTYACSACVYLDFLSYWGFAKLVRVASGVLPSFTVVPLQCMVQSSVVTLGNRIRSAGFGTILI